MKARERLLTLGALVPRPQQSCRRLLTGCLLILLLFAVLSCGLILFLFSPQRAKGAAPPPSTQPPLAVWFLVDNSNSMFEKGGVGSDPELLRIVATRLFVAYLGVDERTLAHQVGVIFFGTEAEIIVPLTPLGDENQRAQLVAALGEPARMGWTDHLGALRLAQEALATTPPALRPALVLLTDGKPETGGVTDGDYQTNTIAALRQVGDELAAAGIPLFVVLLANEVTEADAEIVQVWRPLWLEWSGRSSPGRYFEARAAVDLPGIYHDIVVALTERQTAGAVLDTVVPESGLTQPLLVKDGLAQMTLVVGKSNSAQTVTIVTTDGTAVAPDNTRVFRAGAPGTTLEEVWVFESPMPGNWLIEVSGAGQITVWQDYRLSLATPTPAPATATPSPWSETAVTPAPSLSMPAVSMPTGAATATATPTAVSVTQTHQTRAFALPVLTPTRQAKYSVSPPSARNAPRLLLWMGLLGGTLFTSGTAYALYRWQQVRRPQLSGQLRMLGAHAAQPVLLELDQMRRARLTIGRVPADVPLTGTMIQATLCTGAPIEDTWEVWLKGPSEVLLNGNPVLHDMPLSDTAVLDFGSGVQARYENLRLRRAQRSQQQSSRSI